MIERIIEVVVEKARQQIADDVRIPNEYNSEVSQSLGQIIGDEILGVLKKGNVGDILGIFQRFMSNGSSSSFVKEIVSQFSNILGNKFNIESGKANEIAETTIPEVFKHLVNTVMDPTDNRLTIQDLSSYILNEVPKLRELVQVDKDNTDEDESQNSPLGDLSSMGETMRGLLGGLLNKN